MRRYAALLCSTALLVVTVAGTKASAPVGGARTGFVSSAASTADQVAIGGDPSPGDSPDCLRPLPGGSLDAIRGLPWPIVLTTACGRFVAPPTGLLSRAPAEPGGTPDPGYRVPAGPDSWMGVQSGHVVLVRRGRTVWRSAGGAYDAQDLGSAVLGRGWVVFSTYATNDPSPLFMSEGGGPERVLGHDEDPLVATRWGGFLTSHWRADGSAPSLVARRADGSAMGTVARRVTSMFPEPRGTVLFQKARKLWRTDGLRTIFLADVSTIGSTKYVNVERLDDGRILVSGTTRIAILGPSGETESTAALAPIPRGGRGFVGIHTVVPWGKAVVVAVTRWDHEGMGGGPGWEGVYLLRPGANQARRLFGRKLDIAVCAHSAAFSWRERWLLYSACEGRVVAIDTTGRHAPVVLSRLARILPEPERERAYGLYGAEWAAFGPAVGARHAVSLS